MKQTIKLNSITKIYDRVMKVKEKFKLPIDGIKGVSKNHNVWDLNFCDLIPREAHRFNGYIKILKSKENSYDLSVSIRKKVIYLVLGGEIKIPFKQNEIKLLSRLVNSLTRSFYQFKKYPVSVS
jgi:hypothetical protein